jgi:hypothetical protein
LTLLFNLHNKRKQKMKINIRGASPSHNFEIEVERELTVERLKTAIAAHIAQQGQQGEESISVDRIRLIHMARVLDNARLISDTALQEGQTVHMVIRQVDLTPPPPPQQQATQQPFHNIDHHVQQIAIPQMGDLAGVFSALPGLLGGIVNVATNVVTPQQQQQHRATPGPATSPSADGQQLPVDPAATTGTPQQVPQGFQQVFVHQQQLPHHHHHHHHHHHQHVMRLQQLHQQQLQQQLQQQFQQQQQQQQPFVQGVHVHVHVNFNELDALPARLEQLRRQAPFVTEVRTHVAPPPVVQSPQPVAATQQQSPTAPPQVARGAGAVPAATPAPAARQAPPTAPAASSGPRATLGQLATQAGIEDTSASEPPSSLIDVFSRSIMSNFDVAQLMTLIGGSWAPLERTRDPAAQYIRSWAASNGNPSLVGARSEGRQRFAASSARSLVQSLVENSLLYNLLGPRQRVGTNLFEALERWAYVMIGDLTTLILDGGQGRAFTDRLRQLAVQHVGRLLHYSQQDYLRQGPADLDHIIQTMIRIFLDMAVREQPQVGQHIAAMGPMAVQIAMSTLGQWLQEYQMHFRRGGNDDAAFRTAVPTFAPLQAATAAATPPSAPPAAIPAAAAPVVDMDALLDEAIDESASTPSSASPSASRSVLAAAGIPTDEVDDALRTLQQRHSVPEVDDAAHSDVYLALHPQ